MRVLTEHAFAKLNLSLDVGPARGDGFHEMRTVMQAVTLFDDVAVRLVPGGRIGARSNLSYLPADSRNIACRAAEAFFERTGMTGMGAEIRLKKRIPVCAGMGGGSSDGAAVLRALNRLTGAGLTAAELEELARPLGSDVPFCVAGGAAIGTGRGDVLTPIAPLRPCTIVICKPPFSISTPELFKLIDRRRSKTRPDTDGIIASLEQSDLAGAAVRMYNVFEDVLPRRCAEIAAIKGRLTELGALGAVMSGTGSALFGVFSDLDSAIAARAELRKKYRECYLAHPMKRLDIQENRCL